VIEDERPLFFDYQEPSLLPGDDADDRGVRIAEPVQDCCNGIDQRPVQVRSPVDTEQIRAAVLVRHAFALVIDVVPAFILFEVVLEAVEDAGQILGQFSIAECDQLEQRIEARVAVLVRLRSVSGARAGRRARIRPC
jgi:hypothetical protein